jgi:membrane protein DedA with SNARE-associated domain
MIKNHLKNGFLFNISDILKIMTEILHNIALWVESSKYILIFVGTIFEGPIVMLTSGFLYSLGQFNLIPMYIALVLGDLTADIGWYCLGRFGGRKTVFKYGRFLGVTPEILEKVGDSFNKYHQKILIISKLTMGLGFASVILIFAGISKVPFKKYLVLNLIGGFIWTAILIIIGYFFGNIYALIPNYAKVVFLIVVLVGAIFSIRYFNKYLSDKKI